MTFEEKRKALTEFCQEKGTCDGCKLEGDKCRCGNGASFSSPVTSVCYMSNKEINEAYEIVFSSELTEPEPQTDDPVNHPSYYTDGKIEVLDFIEDKKLGFHLGNAVKYIARAGKKDPAKEVEDLKKAAFYINRKIERLEEAK